MSLSLILDLLAFSGYNRGQLQFKHTLITLKKVISVSYFMSLYQTHQVG
jgi:hypothetical protein